VFTPLPQEGIGKVLGGEVLPIIHTPESIFELSLPIFDKIVGLNFFCDKINMDFAEINSGIISLNLSYMLYAFFPDII